MSVLLDVRHVHVREPSHGTPILHDVSFQLYQGDFMILLGANGSGKSSLMRVLCGLSSPTSGEVLLNGRPLHKLSLSAIASRIRTLTQDPAVSTFGDLTVRENCQLARTDGMDRSALQNYLRDFHPQLPHKLDTFARTLSGGQRQSLALAMGLLRPLTVLLLDEHTSALDPGAAQRVMRLTAACAKQLPHAAIVTATHRLDDALQVGNRLMLLHEGRIAYHVAGDEKRRLTKQELVELY
ncbi:MAG: ATP-binding cassette domain-containing protein [Myxococcota bacterium]